MSAGPGPGPGETRIRELLARARSFVERAGSGPDRLRLGVLLGDRPGDALVELVEARQNREGAIAPLDAGSPPGVSSTAEVLGVLDDLRLLHRRCAERAVAWLATQQRPDGSFEPEVGADAERRRRFTARLAGLLARSPCAPVAVLDAAAGFVAEGFSVERIQDGDWETLASLLACFSNHPHELSDAALQWCGRELERGFRDGRFDAVRTARVFTLCDAQALPGARVEARELVKGIAERQAPDGGFGAPEATTHERVAATLEAALALARLA